MSSPYNFNIKINNIDLVFTASSELFSPKGADFGTLSMLSAAAPFLSPGIKVLDLGCGYGLVGVFAAKLCEPENVVMSDISPLALEFSAKNIALNAILPSPKLILSDGFIDIPYSGFDVILSNPPYHADFSTPKVFIEKGFNRLNIGGRFFMVAKRLDWYKNKITAVFGGLRIHHSGEYYVFEAQRRRLRRGPSIGKAN